MLAGTYPQQQIRANGKSPSPPVVIRPAPNAVVRIQGVQLGESTNGNGPHGVVLRGLRLPGYEVEIFEGAKDITVQDVQAADFYIRGAQRVRIHGGSYGPCLTDGHNAHCGNSKVDTVDPPYVTDDIVIENVVFHDYRIVQGSGAHFECLFIRGGTHVSVIGSRFVNCEFFDLFVQWSGTPIEGLRIERNRFEPAFNGSGQRWEISVMFSGGGYVWPGVRVLRNAFVGTWPIMDDGTNGGFADVVVGENLFGAKTACFRGVTYRGNVGSARACGPSDRAGIFGYRLVDGKARASGGRGRDRADDVRSCRGRPPSGRDRARPMEGFSVRRRLDRCSRALTAHRPGVPRLHRRAYRRRAGARSRRRLARRAALRRRVRALTGRAGALAAANGRLRRGRTGVEHAARDPLLQGLEVGQGPRQAVAGHLPQHHVTAGALGAAAPSCSQRVAAHDRQATRHEGDEEREEGNGHVRAPVDDARHASSRAERSACARPGGSPPVGRSRRVEPAPRARAR